MLVYLHIPFCDSKCPYCAFNSYDNKKGLKKAYMHAMKEQLAYELERFNPLCNSIRSIFIGGGTPSTITASWYEPLFELLQPYLMKNAEITSEANPHSATKEWLEGMKEVGINRISFGVQSFDEQKLRFLGRNHTQSIALKAIETAHHVGIENLSLDLMYGTSMDSLHLLQNDLAIATSLPINHLSAYALTLEEETPFFNRPHVTNGSEELAKIFVAHIIEAGFPQYEISNFGTYQSIHNKGYWEQRDYIGLGSGAVGFLKNARFYPHKNVEAYVKAPAFYEVEKLTPSDLHIEKIFLGLRSNIGIEISAFSTKESEKVALLIQENKLTCKNNFVYNNDYFLSDEIALFITN